MTLASLPKWVVDAAESASGVWVGEAQQLR
jgi:hypothetical protein